MLEGLVFLLDGLILLEAYLDALKFLLQGLHIIHLLLQPALQILVLSLQLLGFSLVVAGKFKANLE